MEGAALSAPMRSMTFCPAERCCRSSSANSYSTCYVLTTDVDQSYADFRDSLKGALGRVPSRGIPRIGALSDMSYGVRQFVMTDPGGNMIRIGQSLSTEVEPRPPANKTRLEKAFEAASLLLYSKEDPVTTLSPPRGWPK